MIYMNIYDIYELLLSNKKEWNLTICDSMDGPREYLTEWSQTEENKYHIISLTCEI